MRNMHSSFRLLSLLALVLVLSPSIVRPAAAEQPTAAGLWQKVDETKTVGWFLFVDHNGVFEGVIA